MDHPPPSTVVEVEKSKGKAASISEGQSEEKPAPVVLGTAKAEEIAIPELVIHAAVTDAASEKTSSLMAVEVEDKEKPASVSEVPGHEKPALVVLDGAKIETKVASLEPATQAAASDVGSEKVSLDEKVKGETSLEDVEKASTVTVPEVPDGGFWAWATVVGAWLIQFVLFGYVNSFGAYQDFYVRKYLLTSGTSQIGWIGGIQTCFTLSMGVITGRLFDAGYFYWLNGASLILEAIAMFMLSLSHENQYYQVFLTHGVAFGLASGLSYLPSLAIVGHHFDKKRAFVVGIVSTGAALGAIVHPIMLNRLFQNEKIGFHNGVRISGAMCVSLQLIANCLMRTRLPPRKSGNPLPLKRFAEDPPYAIAVLSCLFVFLGLFFVLFYLQLFSVIQGVEENLAFYSLSVLNAAGIFGRLLAGYLAPYLGALNLSTFFLAGMGVVTACMTLIRTAGGMMGYAVLYGIVSGAALALSPSMMIQLTDDPGEFGTRLGVFFFFSGIMALFAAPISGALLTDHYRWVPTSLFAGLFCVAGGLTCGVSRTLIARKKGKQIV